MSSSSAIDELSRRPWRDQAWQRRGRGLTRQFYATDEEVTEWLTAALLPRHAPYTLVCLEAAPGSQGGGHVWKTVESAVTGWSELWDRDRWNWFVRSHTLTPVLPLDPDGDSGPWSINGLVNIQHPRADDRGRRLASSIGVVSEVVNHRTGERARNNEYIDMYRSLERKVRAAARVPTIRTLPDGSTLTDSDVALMTENAADSGMSFDVKPGRVFPR